MSNPARDRAVELLTHYFELVARKAGVKWHRDNQIEVTDIVDAIIEAAQAAKDGAK